MTETVATDASASPVDVSVVIGFKDWGIERLRLAVRSLVSSFGDLAGEVIVSDYGSRDVEGTRELIEELGARYVYTPTNGVWSRSRALNAGFAVSVGRVLVSTDADMIFSPLAMQVVGQRLLADPNQAIVLQCRDLPERLDSAGVLDSHFDWPAFEEAATLRPRWGMGGMMAVTREAFLTVRGFDERMEIYGGEDIDFAQRVQWSGRRLTWIDDPDVKMYHLWHPSSRVASDSTPEGRAAIAFNRDIMLNDKSFVRNVLQWRHRPNDARPVATVVISTRNRARFLEESLRSVQAQTVRDIDVIVVDDGSDDETADVVKALGDPRIRYFKRPHQGLAAARNFAASQTRTRYTVIHDDDDLMFPQRVEHHFAAIHAGDSGSYGGWIDFEDEDGSVVLANPGKPFALGSLLFTGKVFAHATLMLETSVIQQLGYDEKLRSGSDYNLAIRMGRVGVALRHSGHYHLIRRLHVEQVTLTDSVRQKSAARLTSTLALAVIPPWAQKRLRDEANTRTVDVGGMGDPEEIVVPFLPDLLVQRDVLVQLPPEYAWQSTDLAPRAKASVRVTDHLDQDRALTYLLIPAASWRDLAVLGAEGLRYDIHRASRRGAEPDEVSDDLDAESMAQGRISACAAQISSRGVLALVGDLGSTPILADPVGDWTIETADRTLGVRVYAAPNAHVLGGLVAQLDRDANFDLQVHIGGAAPGSPEHLDFLKGESQ